MVKEVRKASIDDQEKANIDIGVVKFCEGVVNKHCNELAKKSVDCVVGSAHLLLTQHSYWLIQ